MTGGSNDGRSTGTRPKNIGPGVRRQGSGQGQPGDIANLVMEHQAVKESLESLRKQLDSLELNNLDRWDIYMICMLKTFKYRHIKLASEY